jgi:hypothetical protein
MSCKKCPISNYIPHKQIKDDDNFKEWYEYYKDHLINMYTGTSKIIDESIQDRIFDWDSEQKFNIFVNFIYDSSSKYIPEN